MAERQERAKSREADITACDREPIHLLGRVQNYGALVAVSPDWIVAHASANCGDLIGLSAEELIGTSLTDHIGPQAMHDLRSKMQTLSHVTTGARIFAFPLFEDDRLFDISIHSVDRFFVFEFEPRDGVAPSLRNDAIMVQALIARVQRHSSLEAMTREAARAMRALTNFDRVMVYRFGPDGDGTVIAEALAPGMEPYLGLRYPATDIPKQARELYRRNLLRIIADVDGETSPVLPEVVEGSPLLDLSMATTRAVSEVHLEYLRNMGVQASMSVSIIKQDRLWGLFACHHSAPLHVDYERRTAVELFVQLFNYELSQLEMNEELQELDRARTLQDRLMAQLLGKNDLVDSIDYLSEQLSEEIEFDGLAIYSGNEYVAQGLAPTEADFSEIARFLNTRATGAVFATDRLSRYLGGSMPGNSGVAGILALPLSRTSRDYVVLFRREIVKSVTWAGNPEKATERSGGTARLSPRKSFEAWKEIVRDSSATWTRPELRLAEAVRITLLEVMLKLSNQEGLAERRAREQQEILIDELNHRVRNILNLIRGLLAQRPDEAATVEAYREVLDARIRSLAYAHDQLTSNDWKWVPLKQLIQNEIQAFLSEREDQISVSGDDVALSPNAFTSIALVVHELVTNSVKYGALSASKGAVSVDLSMEDSNAVRLSWVETGGPPVSPPQRAGFGRTIIERSVPFELDGTADVVFDVRGLRAVFTIPAEHVERTEDVPLNRSPAEFSPAQEVRLSGEVMVLEDNLIIAMDAADMLSSLGADAVHTVGRQREALRLLDAHDISFALVDINLGRELSLTVVERCVKEGIPTALATGYGTGGEIIRRYPDIPVIRKPYSTASLQNVVDQLLGKRP